MSEAQSNQSLQELPGARVISLKDTAKLVRTALREAFPYLPARFFFVTCHGDQVDVHYTDGPASDLVRLVCNQFRGTDFDGGEDLTTIRSAPWQGERVRFAAHGIIVTRSYSEHFVRQFLQRFQAYAPADMPVLPDIVVSGGDAYISREHPLHDDLTSVMYTVDAREMNTLGFHWSRGRLAKTSTATHFFDMFVGVAEYILAQVEHVYPALVSEARCLPTEDINGFVFGTVYDLCLKNHIQPELRMPADEHETKADDPFSQPASPDTDYATRGDGGPRTRDVPCMCKSTSAEER